MKNLRKIFAMALAVMLVMSLANTALAATNYTITAPATSHQYEIYQIFTGDLDGSTLSNVVWGQNGTGTKGEAVPDAVLTELEGTTGTNNEKLAVIIKYADLTGTPVATVTNGSTASVPAGYYLIKDKDGTVTGDDTYTTYLVKVVKDVTISPKGDGPKVEKKVKDTNDSTGETTGWQDSADYDVGDTISFKLTATLPSTYKEGYKFYNLVFEDTFENLEDITITSVYPAWTGGTQMDDATDESKKVAFTEDNEYTKSIVDNKLTVTFANLKASDEADDRYALGNSYKIVVEYTAKLSDSAVSGTAGNSNSVTLTYTNDPNTDGTGTPTTGTTAPDTVVVFTYDLVVNKVKEDGETALTGAGFTLYKYDADASTEDKWVAVGSEITGAALTSFTWHGLDDGNYKLVESTTPAGYNTIAPMEFTINAVHDAESQTPQLTNLSSTFDSATVILENGSITGTVKNQQGSTLPETGGIGTTIFYTLGALLVVAAVVLLVTKKRMATAE